MVDTGSSPVPVMDLVSVSASTQTQDPVVMRSIGSDKAVQCLAPMGGVTISCGTECGVAAGNTISTGAQCCVEVPEHTSVGIQSTLPALEAEKVEVLAAAAATTEAEIAEKLPVQSALQLPSEHGSEEVQDDETPQRSSLESQNVDDESAAAPGALVASITPAADDDDDDNDDAAVPVVDDGTVSKAKKNRRKKQKPCVRARAPSGRPVGSAAKDTLPSNSSSWWLSVSPIGSVKRAWLPVLLFVVLNLAIVGVWMRKDLGGAGEAELHTQAIPYAPSNSHHSTERKAQPPMWVAVGGSLTLGDVWAPRAEEGDVFEWFKDGKLLPGRTRWVIWGCFLVSRGGRMCVAQLWL